MRRGSAARDIARPLGDTSRRKIVWLGVKTYGKGRPDSSSPGPCFWRVATFLWLLAIQLMTLLSPVAHQNANHQSQREILEYSRARRSRDRSRHPE